MEFLSLSRRRSSARDVLSDEERGETDVFAGYKTKGEKLKKTGVRQVNDQIINHNNKSFMPFKMFGPFNMEEAGNHR